jgi:hypothetical protein
LNHIGEEKAMTTEVRANYTEKRHTELTNDYKAWCLDSDWGDNKNHDLPAIIAHRYAIIKEIIWDDLGRDCRETDLHLKTVETVMSTIVSDAEWCVYSADYDQITGLAFDCAGERYMGGDLLYTPKYAENPYYFWDREIHGTPDPRLAIFVDGLHEYVQYEADVKLDRGAYRSMLDYVRLLEKANTIWGGDLYEQWFRTEDLNAFYDRMIYLGNYLLSTVTYGDEKGLRIVRENVEINAPL